MPYPYEIDLDELEPEHALCIRRTTTTANVQAVLTDLITEVGEYLKEQKLEAAGPPFARFHSIEADEVDVEAGFPVKQPGVSRWQIRAVELPGGPAVTTMHRGTQEMVRDAHTALHSWMTKEGREPGGPLVEVYLTDPRTAPDPHQRRTRIVQPLKRSSAG
jgi:effector-binding domain-containing protein